MSRGDGQAQAGGGATGLGYVEPMRQMHLGWESRASPIPSQKSTVTSQKRQIG